MAQEAVLLSIQLNLMLVISGRLGDAAWWNKVSSKFAGWRAGDFERADFRAVPGAIVRRSSFIAKGAVLMPYIVNLGAHVR